jgi:hypothetical protein
MVLAVEPHERAYAFQSCNGLRILRHFTQPPGIPCDEAQMVDPGSIRHIALCLTDKDAVRTVRNDHSTHRDFDDHASEAPGRNAAVMCPPRASPASSVHEYKRHRAPA